MGKSVGGCAPKDEKRMVEACVMFCASDYPGGICPKNSASESRATRDDVVGACRDGSVQKNCRTGLWRNSFDGYNRPDLKACADLWRKLRNGCLVARPAFDSDKLRAELAAQGIFTSFPVKAGRCRNYDFSKNSILTATRSKTPKPTSNDSGASASAAINLLKHFLALSCSPPPSTGAILRFEVTP